MSSEDWQRMDLEAGQRVQEKIQFYFLALAFTILALAIQTHDPQTKGAALFELISWLLLCVSGIAGLCRMRRLPESYKIAAHMWSLYRNIEDAEQIERDGATKIHSTLEGRAENVRDYIGSNEKGLRQLRGRDDRLDRHLKLLGRFQELALVSGIIVLGFSRSWPTVLFILSTQ